MKYKATVQSYARKLTYKQPSKEKKNQADGDSKPVIQPLWVTIPRMMGGKLTPQKAVGVGIFLIFVGIEMISFTSGLYVLAGFFFGFLGAVSTFVGFGLWLHLFTKAEVRQYFRKIARDLWHGTKE
jgi:hypothetical protein